MQDAEDGSMASPQAAKEGCSTRQEEASLDSPLVVSEEGWQKAKQSHQVKDPQTTIVRAVVAG